MYALRLLAPLLLAACAAEGGAGAPPPDPGGGGGGRGEGGCVDLSTAGGCLTGGCGEAEVCTVPASRSCGEARCCTLPIACAPSSGELPGAFGCEEDDQCASGLCLPVSGRGICFRACAEDGTGPAGCPPRLACALISLDAEHSVRACVGLGEGGGYDAAAALCRRDGDCSEGRYCQVQEGARFYDGAAYGLCVEGTRLQRGLSVACEAKGPRSEGEGVGQPTLPDRGAGWSVGCTETGFCQNGCLELDPDACNCRQPQDVEFCRAARCVPPCRVDADCPSPLVCLGVHENEVRSVDPGELLRTCQLPGFLETEWGCFDETDCCAGGQQRYGAECCNHNREGRCNGPVAETTHCRVTPAGHRYTSRCELPSGRRLQGEGCAAPDDCESGLCAPDATCTSPCDPGPGDRCGELLPGTRCCPMPLGESCVPACRLDCDGGPACVP